MLFCCLWIFFFRLTFSKKSFRNTIRVSSCLDPDQAQHFVGPDLGPNCLQRLSADEKSCQWRGKSLEICVHHKKSRNTCVLNYISRRIPARKLPTEY